MVSLSGFTHITIVKHEQTVSEFYLKPYKVFGSEETGIHHHHSVPEPNIQQMFYGEHDS